MGGFIPAISAFGCHLRIWKLLIEKRTSLNWLRVNMLYVSVLLYNIWNFYGFMIMQYLFFLSWALQAPEKIEGVYAHSKFIAQIFAHGDSLQVFIPSFILCTAALWMYFPSHFWSCVSCFPYPEWVDSRCGAWCGSVGTLVQEKQYSRMVSFPCLGCCFFENYIM